MSRLAIRRESVVLSLDDRFSGPMARAAAVTKLLKNELGSLDGTAVRSSRSTEATARSVDGLGKGAKRNGDSINQLTGRVRLLAEAGVLLGPALVPIGAAAIPAIAGLAVAFTAAAAGAGVALLAFNGVGEALSAIDAYQLEPTTANLAKMRAEFDSLGPAGAEFARYIDSLGPQLSMLQDVAREGLLPGVEEGIDNLMSNLPQLQRIVFNLATAMGDLSESAGAGLSGDGFEAFFNYMESDAGPTIEAFGQSLGNIAEGFAGLTVALAPLTRSFTGGLEEMTASFATWAAGVGETQGFRDFVSYVQQSAPQVLDLLGSLGSAFVGIATAVAPVGDAVLPVLTALANVLGAVASSPIGPPLFAGVAALVALNRAAVIATATMKALGVASVAAGTAGGATAGGAAAGLAAKAKGIAPVAAVATVALGAASTTDSFLRTREAADATATSVRDLASALSDSNVGKYASDLGIDVNKLATELATSGTESEYVQSAMVRLRESAYGSGAAIRDIGTKWLPGYTSGAEKAGSALKDFSAITKNSEGVIGGTVVATESYAAATQRAAASAAATRTEIAGLVTAMQAQTSAALSAFGAETQYANALKAARDAGKASNAGINLSTEAGRANRDVISGLAGAWNNQSAAVKNSTGRFQAAKGAFIETATAMGVPEAAARRLAGRLLEIPKKVVTRTEADTRQAAERVRAQTNSLNKLAGMRPVTKVDADTGGANSKVDATRGKAEAVGRLKPSLTIGANVGNALGGISAVQGALNALQSKTITLTTIRSEIRRGNVPLPGAASGTTVPKDGGVYADRFLYMLAPGEEVISNRSGQADAFRADRAAGRIPGYAGGGTIPGLAAGGTSRDSGPTTNLYAGRPTDRQVRGLEREQSRAERALKGLERQVERSTEALSVSEDAVSRERSARDDLTSAFGSLSDDIAGMFKSDLFTEMAPDVWRSNLAGGSDPIAALESDIGNGQAFSGLLASLQSRGLDGAALQAGAQGGVSGLQTLAAYDDGNLRRFEDLFNQRESLAQQTGNAVAQAQFGAALMVADSRAATAEAQRDQVNAVLVAMLAAQRSGAADVRSATQDVAQAQRESNSKVKQGGRNRSRSGGRR